MKNLSILLLIVMVSLAGNSQEIIIKKGSTVKEVKKGAYYKIPDLDKFEGKWEYRDGTEKFTVVISNKKTFLKGKGLEYYIDYLQGNYCYIKEGQHQKCDNKKTDEYTVYDGIATPGSDVAHFSFIDTQKEKRGNVTFELLSNNKAKWTLGNREVVTINNKNYDYSFSVPTQVILTKME